MKKLIARILTVAALGLAPVMTVGCAHPVTPVQVATTAEQAAAIAVSAAQTAWAVIQPSLPAATAAAINAQFAKGIVDVNKALAILNDAVVVYQNSQGTAPNFAAMVLSLSDAVNEVLAIVNQYKNSSVASTSDHVFGASAPLPGYADLVSSAATLNRAAGR